MLRINNTEILKPQNWQDFERLVESYAMIKWPNGIITPFGGNGQTQHGVDIYVKDKRSCYIGIQCKKVAKLTLVSIQKEITKALAFKPVLKRYIIATSMGRNATLQENINALDAQHKEKGLFQIDILFWEDIIKPIMSNDDIFKQHYPQYFLGNKSNVLYLFNASNNRNSIIGNNNTNTIIKTSQVNVKRNPIQNTIGSDTHMKNYVRHLIQRYHEYKKIDMGKDKMNYTLIYKSIEREIGYKWDETPEDLFSVLCSYLQERIDNTIFGKHQKSRGVKNYSTYTEFFSNRPSGPNR